jgi:hypothetical protein
MAGQEDLGLDAMPGRPMWFWPAVLAVLAGVLWVVLTYLR